MTISFYNNHFYNSNASTLAEQYLALSFEEVHQDWFQFLAVILEKPDAHILDIGAGAGRDSKFLAKLAAKTHSVNNNVQILAVEPAQKLLDIGQKKTKNLSVTWLNDALPTLNKISELDTKFDLILLSAVWMHLPPEERLHAINTLSHLLNDGGILVISLRHGQTEEDLTKRGMHTVCANELKKLANSMGLNCIHETPFKPDKLGREHLSWQTLVLQARRI
ncbi:class I SAM-dependent methyltransferase [Flocculibacter collagenilyticus]|uniref:class I SAM-dependent methyltransferase n=1 Tax=Flocculibacter collagenilyticus TaxID=2744479 RepID=UPI0018F7BEAE|nr:class I SAM-dependent methyltransferase [Flocculibacter collagenilyticus]